MPRLFLVRHGASSADATPRYFGHTDLSLTSEGERQAERLRDRFARERLDIVYASDLARCRATAEVIAAAHGQAAVLRPDLREINFGQFEGLSFAEIEQRYPGASDYWRPEASDLPFPGGESVAMLAHRVHRFVAECARLDSGATALVVSHGGPLKLLICRALGLRPSQWWQLRLDLGSLSILDLYPDGVVLGKMNDTSHLG